MDALLIVVRHRVGVLLRVLRGVRVHGQAVILAQHSGVGDHARPGVMVRQPLGLDQPVGHIHPEAVHATVQPEAQDVLELVPDLRVLPVQIRLGGVEQVQVPVPGGAVRVGRPGPGVPAEGGLPVVRRLGPVLALAGAEHVALALRGARLGGQGCLEPRVLRGGVVGDQVHDDPQPGLVRGGDQVIGVLQGAEQRVHVPVVGHVIAAVLLRGDVERGEPHRVHTELLQVGQLGGHAGQIAHAVAVRIREGPGVDLVDHRVHPPGVGRTVPCL